MPIQFNTLLQANGFPITDVRLLRHKDLQSLKGRSPYELWRDDRPEFDFYQSTQSLGNAKKLNAPFWASFIGTPADETLFVGMFCVSNCRLNKRSQRRPHMAGVDAAGTVNIYDLQLDDRMSDLIGKLIIKWGPGDRAWIQRADSQDKQVQELRPAFKEPEFPGFLNFIEPLSRLESLPASWITALKSSRGVYLLSCPHTKEQYIGSATGDEAFWGRWQTYVGTGHGGNVGMKCRDPSDYQVCILEVAGTAATTDDILRMEQRWKRKMQSVEMGLNRN
jgi:hypothetical protein